METKTIIGIAKEWKDGKRYVAVDDVNQFIYDELEERLCQNPNICGCCETVWNWIVKLKKELKD